MVLLLFQYLFVGLAAGWIMGKIRRGHGYGFFGNLLVGAMGSFIGWFLMGFLKVEATNVVTQIVMAVAGAVVFFLIVGLFSRKGHKKSKKDDDE